MKKYKLLMHGRNFLIETKSKPERFGFYQTIYLESTDCETAENKAVDIIRNSDLKDMIKNEPNDPPMIYLDEIEEVESFEYVGELIGGRTMYSDDPED